MKVLKEQNNRRAKSYKAIDGSVQMQSSRSKPGVGISPFRMSSEWAALKAEAVKGNEMDKRRDKEREKESEKERIKDIKYGAERNGTNNQLALLNADSKSNKPLPRDNSDRTLGADSRSLGGGAGPRGNRSNRDNKSDEDMEGRSGRSVPGKEGEVGSMMDDGNAKQRSGNTTSPESKVVYSDKSGVVDYPSSPPPKPVRSVLGQYEANMASAGKTDKSNEGRGKEDKYDKDGVGEHKNDHQEGNKSTKTRSKINGQNNNSGNQRNNNNNGSGSELDADGDKAFSMSNPSKSSTRGRSKGRRYNDNDDNDNDNDRDNDDDDYKDSARNYPNSQDARDIKDGHITPENIPQNQNQNVPGNRLSWGKGLFGRRKSKVPEDPSVKRGSLKLPHPAHSPVEKASRFIPTWMRKSGDSGGSSPVNL